jgi:hypothetical protein
LFDFLTAEVSRTSLAAILNELKPTSENTVLRVTFTGVASPSALTEARAWLDPQLSTFLVGQLIDRTRIALSSVELADLQTRHPILAQVLSDIDRIETFAGGTVPTSTPAPVTADAAPPSPTSAPLTLAEVQKLLTPSRIELAQLTPEFFTQLRQTVFQALQEVAR